MSDTITDNTASKKLINFFQIIHMRTYWNIHPEEMYKPYAILWHSTFFFFSSKCQAAALQLSRNCFDITGSMTESHRDHASGEKVELPEQRQSRSTVHVIFAVTNKQRKEIPTQKVVSKLKGIPYLLGAVDLWRACPQGHRADFSKPGGQASSAVMELCPMTRCISARQKPAL